MRFRPISVNIANIDYSVAVASAVAWLGNRYLLATPAGRLPEVEQGNEARGSWRRDQIHSHIRSTFQHVSTAEKFSPEGIGPALAKIGPHCVGSSNYRRPLI
jgi:hypothetical protein